MPLHQDRLLNFHEVIKEEVAAIATRREFVFKEAKEHDQARNERAGAIEPATKPPPTNDQPQPAEPGADQGEPVPPLAGGADGGRSEAPPSRALKTARNLALGSHHVGLTFSGGGIRSGTFAVGIMQGLASLGLLRRIDYLSTVSGGGYAGAWLAAWLRREGSVVNVEDQLNPNRVVQAEAKRRLIRPGKVVDEEPEPIYHLRANSRFLAPNAGMLSPDIWSIVATWLRNVTINLTMLLPAAMVVVLLVRALVWICRVARQDYPNGQSFWLLMAMSATVGAIYLYRGFKRNAMAVNYLRHPDGPRHPVDRASMVVQIALPILVGVVLLPLALVAIFNHLPAWLTATPASARDISGGLRSALGHPSGLEVAARLLVIALAILAAFAPKGATTILGIKPDYLKLLLISVLLPLAVACVASFGEPRHHHQGVHSPKPGPSNGAFQVAIYLAPPVLFGLLLAITYSFEIRRGGRALNGHLLRSAATSGAAGGLMFSIGMTWLPRVVHYRPDLLATLAPPLCLLIIVATTILHVAQLRYHIRPDEREWWAYFDAYMLLMAVAWLATFGTILYFPFLVRYVEGNSAAWITRAMAAGWVGTTVAGLLAGRSARTGVAERRNNPLEWIAAIAPPVFLIGLFGALSLLASWWIDDPKILSPDWSTDGSIGVYFHTLNDAPIRWIESWILLSVIVTLVVSHFVDVNLFSLNAMYGARLARCYLGASRPKANWTRRWQPNSDPRAGGGAATGAPPPVRSPNPVTGFDSDDDLPLFDLQLGAPEDGRTGYHGPIFLINTSLNLVASEDLAWADRKSESFVLSPYHCGSKGTGYVRVTDETVRRLTVGRSIAISGAAVDPNMNFHQSAALTALLTVFNARLGYWIENPSAPVDRAFDLNQAIAKAELAVSLAPGQGRERTAARKALKQARADWDTFESEMKARGEKLEKTRQTVEEFREAREVARRGVEAASEQLETARKEVATADTNRLDAARRVTTATPETETKDLRDALADFEQARKILGEAQARLVTATERVAFGEEAQLEAAGAAGLWTADTPQYGGLLVSELLGRTDAHGKFVHLTDGGHFENTGAYELIRRRCRYIICCDANEDRTASDENLANLARLVMIDFGIRIQLDTTALKLNADRLCQSHVVIGHIRYDDVDNGQVPGVLVYIRTSMTGDEPSDIQNYATINREFPYTSSAQQFFDESQFESYRGLGVHIARVVFKDARDDAVRTRQFWSSDDAAAEFKLGNKQLFAALRRRWGETPLDNARSLEAARDLSAFQRDLRRDEVMLPLSQQIYSELHKTTATKLTPEVELHSVAQMLQIMENAWLALNVRFDEEGDIDQGWMNLFRRWAATEPVRRHWPTLRSEFGTEFVRFCETRLDLVPAMPEIVSRKAEPLIEEWVKLTNEFFAEHSNLPDRLLARFTEVIKDSLYETVDLGGSLGTSPWAILQGPKPGKLDDSRMGQGRGFIFVWEYGKEDVTPETCASDTLPAEGDHELLIWVRPAHRSIGLGGYCLDTLLEGPEGLIARLQARKVARLWVNYPDGSRRAAEKWRRFFGLYDFRPNRTTVVAGSGPMRLYRDL